MVHQRKTLRRGFTQLGCRFGALDKVARNAKGGQVWSIVIGHRWSGRFGKVQGRCLRCWVLNGGLHPPYGCSFIAFDRIRCSVTGGKHAAEPNQWAPGRVGVVSVSCDGSGVRENCGRLARFARLGPARDPTEALTGTKIQLALVLAEGATVAAWGRDKSTSTSVSPAAAPMMLGADGHPIRRLYCPPAECFSTLCLVKIERCGDQDLAS